MTEQNVCPQCGNEMAADAPAGLCPECLLRQGMQDSGVSGIATALAGFVPPTPQELSQKFPQLEILEFVGKGGMGAVYKARQPNLDRLVALKILPPEVARDPAFAERFLREARALARLSHPQVVAVYDFGESDGLFYFVMEYVDGANLRQTIQVGKLSPNEALAIVPQICEALQFAHDEGVVHRDIKPENILIDQKGRVKIADFGLAKIISGEDATDPERPFTLTGTHQVMGTIHYMAPEQVEGSHAVDHRADIYSLGVVFYEMLTGELPIGRFAAPSEKVRMDIRLDEVVLRSLEKEPERRYQRAGDVKTEVESISGSSDSAPKRTSSGSGRSKERETLRRASGKVSPKLPETGKKRSPVLMVLVSLLILIGVVLSIPALWMWLSYQEPLVVNQNRTLSDQPQDISRAEENVPSSERSYMLTMTKEGPALTEQFSLSMKLDAEQLQKVNIAIQELYPEYSKLLQEHVKESRNSDGHRVVKVSPFLKELTHLEEKLWGKIDPLINVEQQNLLRLNLPLRPKRVRSGSYTGKTYDGRGIFGYGTAIFEIEMWRVGEWYHWRVQDLAVWSGSFPPHQPERSPELPEAFRMWDETAEEEP